LKISRLANEYITTLCQSVRAVQAENFGKVEHMIDKILKKL